MTDWLILPAWATLVWGALEDVETMSVPQWLLLAGWGFAAMWALLNGVFPLTVLALFLLTLWGLGQGAGYWAFLAFPFPAAWPVLLLGAGAREGIAGEGEVVGISLASLFSPWAGWAALLGLLLWQKVQRKRGKLWTPAIPGILAGLTAYFLVVMRW